METVMETAVILLPVHKPGEELVRLCQNLAGTRVVIIDSGSGKDYDDIFRRASEYGDILRLEKNKGRGAALKHGLRHVLVNAGYGDAEVIVTADLRFSASDILAVAEKTAEAGGLVIGSRKNGTSAAKLGRGLTDLVFRIGAGKGVSDTLSGLRGFTRTEAAEYADLSGNRFELEMNMLFSAVEAKTPITETNAAEVSDTKGWFRFHPVFDTVRVYWSVFLASRSLKYIFSSGVAFIIDYVLLLLLAKIFTFDGAIELIAAPGAWIVSSLTNFFLNRNFVFRSNAPLKVALPEYYGLAGVVFLLKTYVLLELMHRVIGIPLGVAKLVAEVVFFISNYFIQKKFIFKKKEK